MAKEQPPLDPPWGNLPFPGEPWVRDFELANGFTGLSAKYKLPDDPGIIERLTDLLSSPKGRLTTTPERHLSLLTKFIDQLQILNPALTVPSRDPESLDAEEAFIRSVIGGCNPDAVNYEVKRQLNLADPLLDYDQKLVDEQQRIRLARLARRFEDARGSFTPPAVFWNISPADMTSLERQVDGMFPKNRPAQKRGPSNRCT